ncbi:MAG: hypothetical protein V8T17_04240 [Oscillospiraceae bacterium]
MENYQKMYSTLFNAITDALAQIEKPKLRRRKIHTHRCPAKSRRNVYHSTELK